MNSKNIALLKNRLRRVKDRTFEEDDIKLLLIEIRDYLEDESFLKEVCDFVAHPKRSKGICHQRIDSRYAKFKFHREGSQRLEAEGQFALHKHKPWSFFSNQILSYLKTDKIEKNLFELVILEGMEEISNGLFLQYYQMNQSDVRKLINKYYRKEKGFYVLSEKISHQKYQRLDDLLKFIRGTITGKSAFNQYDLSKNLNKAIARINQITKSEFDQKALKKEMKDIIICILCILHDADFLLFDGTVAKSFLSIHPTSDKRTHHLCLMAEASSFVFPVIMTEIVAKDYIEVLVDNPSQWELQPIPWIHFQRYDDKRIALGTADS